MARTKRSCKQASKTYQVLCDPDKRAAYDRYGHAGLGGAGFRASPFAGGVDISDIFGDLFGEMFEWTGRDRAVDGNRASNGADRACDST